MVSVLRGICDWATTLPYWEQAALDKILTGVQFSDSDYDELLHYLLEEADLAQPSGHHGKGSNDRDTTQVPLRHIRSVAGQETLNCHTIYRATDHETINRHDSPI